MVLQVKDLLCKPGIPSLTPRTLTWKWEREDNFKPRWWAEERCRGSEARHWLPEEHTTVAPGDLKQWTGSTVRLG